MEGLFGSSVHRKRRRGVGGGVLGVSSGGAGEGDGVKEEADERVGAEGVEGGTGDKTGAEGEL